MNSLERQRRARTRRVLILYCICRYNKENGFSPTIRELQKETGLKSASSVYAHVKALEKLGLIERKPGRARTLSVNREALQRMLNDPVGRLLFDPASAGRRVPPVPRANALYHGKRGQERQRTRR